MSSSHADLRDFVADLEKAGDLRRIRAEVDPVLEITEITDRVVKRGGPALLFEKPKGSRIPVLINAFGTERRMARALGVGTLTEVADEIEGLIALFETKPAGLLDKLRMLPKLKEISDFFPKDVKSGPCQEVVRTDDADLRDLPILQCWPQDAGRFITLPLVITRDPETGKRNVGTYRMQVFDGKTTAMHWQRHKGGAAHFRRATGARMPVAVAIGCDPATVWSGILPLPPGVDELIVAGFVRKAPVPLVKCRTVDLEVPANAEIVLEGYVVPGEYRKEGPFGDHTGFYSLPDDFPVFHLTALTHRKDPLYQTIVVGRPVQEDCFMGLAVERVFLPLIRKQIPEIVDLHMPFEGIFHNLVIVSIRKEYPGHARKVMHAIWGLGGMMFSKAIVVVDEDVPVRDVGHVTWKVLNNIDPERDIEFAMGPVDDLDHAARLPAFGSKMGVDGTRKGPGEGVTRPWPDEMLMSPEVRALVDRRWKEYGI
ncbi:MAG: menaquinone biosynthesis decarboxylase [Planctomycetales bacterium]|nr:menaquinone biosynthesis decarboxylase [Planctomycetales bacterium]